MLTLSTSYTSILMNTNPRWINIFAIEKRPNKINLFGQKQ